MTNSRTSKYRFNWRHGNRFELLIDGSRFFPRMLSRITSARKSVWLEMYLFETSSVASQFIDALLEVANRGVLVKILLDDYGSRGLNQEDRDLLEHDNIDLCFYNKLRWAKYFENMARDHRKLLIVDGKTAYVGGAGINDKFAPSLHGVDRQWRETMVEISGPVLADWQILFAEAWRTCSTARIEENFIEPDIVSDNIRGRVMVASGFRAQGIMRAVIKRIRASTKIVWLSTAYFVPSRKLRRSLRRAAGQGADVRLLLAGPETDHPAIRIASHRYYTALLRSGVRIFEYQPRVLHSKTLICDQWVSMGSSNFDRWNLRWNLEANQAVDDLQFSQAVAEMFIIDFTQCSEINLADWLQRPGYLKWWERFWGRVDHWLHQLGRGR